MGVRVKVGGVSEAKFMRQVIDLAHLRGWKVAHFRAARTNKGWCTPVGADGAGWPDLFLVRGGRCFAVELKVGSNRPSPPQVAWLKALNAAGVTAVIWRPADWKHIEAELE